MCSTRRAADEHIVLTTVIITNPPPDGVPLVIYDGQCRFCVAQAERLQRIARGRIRLRPCGDEVERDYPGVTTPDCLREMKFIAADGRVSGGADAVVLSLVQGRSFGALLLPLYRLGIIRGVARIAYRFIARNRYRFFGRTGAACDNDRCAIHMRGS